MDKPTTTELLEWLTFVLGSASFGGKADAIRAILTEHPKLQAERDKFSLAIDQVVAHAEKADAELAQVKSERKKYCDECASLTKERERLIAERNRAEDDAVMLQARLALAEPLLSFLHRATLFDSEAPGATLLEFSEADEREIIRLALAHRKAVEGAKEGGDV
jgi:hypothetical protein